MKRLLKTILIVLTAIAGAYSCASTSGIRNAPFDQGTEHEFSGSYADVLSATRDAIIGAGLAIDSFEEVDTTTAVIVSKKGASTWSWGELVRVVVKGVSEEKTTVRVLTKRRLATNVTAKGDYAETIFSNIDLSLR